jgi:GntR family transcriptional regulator/MocR family aminotransferase
MVNLLDYLYANCYYNPYLALQNSQYIIKINARSGEMTMLTYDLSDTKIPLYQQLYECIKGDISSGKLQINEKMPSKRTLADNLGVSTITVENAYDQLIGEGYMYSLPRRGYFISDISDIRTTEVSVKRNLNIEKGRKDENYRYDFSSNKTESGDFPFSVWAKLMRDVISLRTKDLLTVSPCEGVKELREAIADHLHSFRGMNVDPDQIVVGAGTEYLYSLLIQLLGRDRIYCLENPGYKKLQSVYESHGVTCRYVDLDEYGINVKELKSCDANVVHTSPNHHFPTGITMPISRRYELLAWCNEKNGRYIIEDDYDSEFRLNGKPIPPLQSIDACEKVIYMNTFSKSLTSTIRISYMVLPEHLANLFFEKLSFYACTVSTFEQYTLAEFIKQGYFEKHINRMKLRYGKKRNLILHMIGEIFSPEECRVIENGSGLHLVLEFHTTMPDQVLKHRLWEKKIKIASITDYYMDDQNRNQHQFIVNYSSLDMEGLKEGLLEMKRLQGSYRSS